MKSNWKSPFGICLVFLIFMGACHSSSREHAAAEKDFTVIFGSGGGFTGMAEGYVIHSSGKIEKWSGRYFQRGKIEAIGTVAPEALLPLRQAFATKAFMRWSHQGTGNMTTRVWCISGMDTTIISWPGLDPGAEVPPAIRDFYSKLRHAVQSSKN